MHKWFIVLLVWSVCPCLVYGQDTELKSVKGKAAIREYDKTTEELEKEYQKKLADLDKEFRMKSELVKARLFTNLNEALTEEARKVNLPEANKINAEIERYKAMPLPNLVQTDGAGGEMSKADFLELIKGEWIGEWGTTKNNVYWLIEADGKTNKFHYEATPKGAPATANIRSPEYVVKVDINHKNGVWSFFQHNQRNSIDFMTQALPFGNQGDRLLLLGWHKYKTNGKNVLTDTPEHVTILKKK